MTDAQCNFYNGEEEEEVNPCALQVECAYKVVVKPKQVIQLWICLALSQDSEVGKSSVTKRDIF